MTKWAQGVHTAIHDNVFWLWVYCSNKSREPLTHFMLWVQKFTNDWPVFRLVCGQLDEFMAEFNEVVSSFDEWFATALCESGCDMLCNQALQQLRSEVMDVTLLHVAGFRRRIFDPFQKRDCCVTVGCLLSTIVSSPLRQCVNQCFCCQASSQAAVDHPRPAQ